jgi:hypothetical protein
VGQAPTRAPLKGSTPLSRPPSRAGIDHIVGLRERVGELILLAIDETGWHSLVGLSSGGFLAARRSPPTASAHAPIAFSASALLP